MENIRVLTLNLDAEHDGGYHVRHHADRADDGARCSIASLCPHYRAHNGRVLSDFFAAHGDR